MPTSDQLELFADAGAASGAAEPVSPADPSPELQALGARLPAGLYLGTSSWSFPGWRGLVYADEQPRARLASDGLQAYARHPLLRAVGVDRSFYGPLPVEQWRRYALAVPAGFRFVVKAPSLLTTPATRPRPGMPRIANPGYLDADYARSAFLAPLLEGLADKLAVVVLQFPPQGPAVTGDPGGFARRLGALLAALPDGAEYAVELRDPALLTQAFSAALDRSGARYCVGVHPRMPPVDEQIRIAATHAPGTLVVRWNLHAGLGYEEAKARYAPFDRLRDEDPDTRTALARAVVHTLERGREAYVLVNNKAEGCAPCSLRALAEAIEREPLATR